MSRILFSSALVPDAGAPVRELVPDVYENAVRIEKTKAISLHEQDISLPDRRAYRSMSRAAVLMAAVCLEAEKDLAGFLDESAFSVGIYCAMENGPVDFSSTRQMLSATPETFAQLYRKYRNPKMYLKQLPNLAAAQTGIFLGILGPMHVYNHSALGSLQALEQAEMDLADGRISAALVCSAFSFENPVILERLKRTCPGETVLCEGAGALLLGQGDPITNWRNLDDGDTHDYYGISHQLIVQILKRRHQQ